MGGPGVRIMEKLVFALGPYEVFRVKPKVLAVYKNGRFQNNYRPADDGFKAYPKILANAIAYEAADKANRAAFVEAGRARKAAARAANAVAKMAAPEFAF